MSPIVSKIQYGSQGGLRPPAAVELSREGVLAAARFGQEPPVFAFAGLQADALIPSVDDPNLRAREVVTEAIRTALESVSPKNRSVTLIVPDAAVRVFVLDFDSLPAKAAEAIPVLRFRLRKMVHFDVEKAGVSYQILSETKTECRALIAVIPGPILEEYETAARAAGYEPGAVLPSSLAALASIDSEDAVLAACMSGSSLTTSITHGKDLLLYRTLELPTDPALRLSEVQRDIAVAAAYFEDKLARRPRWLHYAGIGTAEEFARWMRDPEFTVIEMTPRPDTGATTALKRLSLAGITGALAGAA